MRAGWQPLFSLSLSLSRWGVYRAQEMNRVKTCNQLKAPFCLGSRFDHHRGNDGRHNGTHGLMLFDREPHGRSIEIPSLCTSFVRNRLFFFFMHLPSSNIRQRCPGRRLCAVPYWKRPLKLTKYDCKSVQVGCRLARSRQFSIRLRRNCGCFQLSVEIKREKKLYLKTGNDKKKE